MCSGFEEDEELFSAAKLEGYYRTWTLFADRLVTGNVHATNPILISIDEISRIIYFAYLEAAATRRFEVRNLDTDAVIFVSPLNTLYQYVTPLPSLMQWAPSTAVTGYGQSRNRYMLLLRSNGQDLEIWKDGILLQTINTAVLGLGNKSIYVTHSGKYISFSAYGNRRYLIYQGV